MAELGIQQIGFQFPQPTNFWLGAMCALVGAFGMLVGSVIMCFGDYY